MMVKTLHLISWNINRGSTLQAKLEAILSCNPDLITLQEVTQEAVTYIKQNLKGYFITDTLNGNSRGCDSRFWDNAERNIFSGLSNFDLTDIYRLVNGYDNVRDFSYYVGGEWATLRPYHCVSFALRCDEWYLHSVREAKLSDHSAIEAIFNPENLLERGSLKP